MYTGRASAGSFCLDHLPKGKIRFPKSVLDHEFENIEDRFYLEDELPEAVRVCEEQQADKAEKARRDLEKDRVDAATDENIFTQEELGRIDELGLSEPVEKEAKAAKNTVHAEAARAENLRRANEQLKPPQEPDYEQYRVAGTDCVNSDGIHAELKWERDLEKYRLACIDKGQVAELPWDKLQAVHNTNAPKAVSYTHLRAHET